MFSTLATALTTCTSKEPSSYPNFTATVLCKSLSLFPVALPSSLPRAQPMERTIGSTEVSNLGQAPTECFEL